tara:strand:- start:1785 stop:2435 length:651 start_codon:yes stop_codon:yes gene_type:complete
MAEKNWYDDVMGFFGQDAESVIGGRTPSKVTGKVKANFGDFLAGRSQAELNTAYDQMTTTTRRTKGKEALEESGYTATELGLNPDATSRSAVASAIRRLGEEKAETNREQGITDQLRMLQATQAPQLAGIQAGLTKAEQQTQLLLQQGKDAHALQLQELAANRDSQAAQLEYQKMRDRRADQEYNERMERLDRKDRQAMMQNLAAGLASLGAAFAL